MPIENDDQSDIRSLLEGAMNAQEDGDVRGASEDKSAAGANAEVLGDGKQSNAGESGAAASGAAEPVDPASSRARAPDGKFAKEKKGQEARPVKPAAAKTAVVAEGAVSVPPSSDSSQLSEPPKPTSAAPQNWKPAAREKWASLPPEVQAEATRVHLEVRQVMQDSAKARELQQTFQQTIAPFEGMMRAEGHEPMRAIADLLQTAAALRTAPMSHRANIIANMVKTFGIPYPELVRAIDEPGGASQQSQNEPMDVGSIIARAKAELRQELAQTREQASVAHGQQVVEEFKQNAEFLEDVRHDMALIMDADHRRGLKTTIQQAYDKACRIHPEISLVLEQRKAAEAAKAGNASTLRARAASSSVRGQPAAVGVSNGESKSIRGTIEASIAALSGR